MPRGKAGVSPATPSAHRASRAAWASILGHRTALGLLTVLALALSWPLPARLNGWVPGVPQWAFDEFTFVWNIWYFKYAAVDRLVDPLRTELIYYPLGIDLILYTYNLFNALVAQPVYLALNLVVASNTVLWLSTVLSGYGTYLLVCWLLAHNNPRAAERGGHVRGQRWDEAPTLAALLAGILYAFASNRAVYMTLGHYDMVTTQWIPFYALALLQALAPHRPPAHRLRSGALAGLFFALAGLAEMIVAVFLAIFTLIVLLVHGREILAGRPRSSRAAPPPGLGLAALALAGAVAFLLWSPVLIPILRQFITQDFALKGWGEAIPLSTDLLGWFTPTVLHPVFGGDLVAELRRVQLRALEGGVTGFRDINTVFIGWATGLLALVGFLAFRRQVRIWAWTALVFGLFTLGPFLQINGRYRFDLDGVETSFPLPYALLHYIPIVRANRAPNRNSVLLMLGVAVLVGYGVYWLSRRAWGRRQEERGGAPAAVSPRAPSLPRALLTRSGLLAGLLGLLILFEHLAVPLPLSDARVPEVYTQIAADPRPVSVMHLPLGWRNSFGTLGPERTRLQYYQTVHQKPMLGGNISRAPDFKMDYFRRIPLFQALVEVQSKGQVDPALVQAAKTQAPELVYLYNIGYVLLFPAIPQRFPYADTWQESWRLAWEILPLEREPFWTGQGIRAYRTVQPPGTDRFQLRLGEPGTFPYRAEGWDGAETDTIYGQPAIWATGTESCLLIPLRQVQDQATYTLTVDLHPFAYPNGPTQVATAVVNGQTLDPLELADGWQTRSWSVPGAALRNTVNRVCLRWAYAAVPRQVIPGHRAIGTTGTALPVDVEVKSFPEGAFIALFDPEGRMVDGSAGRRGLNVTVLDPESGAVLAKEGFDTAANEYESQKLAQFLAEIPPGRIVIVAAKGAGWLRLTAEAVEALRDLGADVTQAALQERYLALVGVQGSPPGSAAWVLHPQEAFLRIGLNPDRRSLAAAVGRVWIGR